ncbi:YciI family protein [Nocardioides sp. SYSU D00038]|uniref:YciI family protein n=1 Tax=Nocardioides sp. SYSU D00038 TaxID=2812554 RepID=UPI0027DD2FAE|nr:YciI family protein [Nocardioides sp. SYSU D00038]
MKFLLLMAEAEHFERWDAADDEARERTFAAFAAFDEAVEQRGSIVGGEALDRPATARTVRPGTPRHVTAGPFAETVEQTGGFYVIDVPSLDDAVELAGLLPAEYTIEVRPCVAAPEG